MKSVKRNSIIILVLTIGMLIFMVRNDYKNIAYWLVNSNKLYILLAVVVYFLSLFADSRSLHLLIRQYSHKYNYKRTVQLNLMTKFFNGITPLSTGGQPLQIYELHKKGVRINDATNIIIQFFIVFQIALVSLSSVMIVLNSFMHIFEKNLLLKKLTIIGYCLNVLGLLLFVFISFNKRFNIKIAKIIIRFLHKIKIVKNKDAQIEKWTVRCTEFYESAKVFRKSPGVFLKSTFWQVVQLILLYSVPLFIAFSIKDTSKINLFNTIAASSYIFLIGCYVPIPGGTGGMEFGFMGMFKNILKKSSITAVTILWRFATYYLPVIIGGIIFNITRKKKYNDINNN